MQVVVQTSIAFLLAFAEEVEGASNFAMSCGIADGLYHALAAIVVDYCLPTLDLPTVITFTAASNINRRFQSLAGSVYVIVIVSKEKRERKTCISDNWSTAE